MADLPPSANAFALPGDVIMTPEQTAEAATLSLGPGLSTVKVDSGVKVVASRPGVVKESSAKKTYWVDTFAKRYTAARGDFVVGTITQTAADDYEVDIGTNLPARLPVLAFEGATKRNRPKLKIGDLVYARVALADKHIEPDLTCVDSSGRAEGMGPLEGGFVFDASLSLCRRLLNAEAELLHLLGNRVKFEIAVGLNGKVWVKAPTTAATVLVVNAIKVSEFMTPRQKKAMIKRLWEQAERVM